MKWMKQIQMNPIVMVVIIAISYFVLRSFFAAGLASRFTDTLPQTYSFAAARFLLYLLAAAPFLYFVLFGLNTIVLLWTTESLFIYISGKRFDDFDDSGWDDDNDDDNDNDDEPDTSPDPSPGFAKDSVDEVIRQSQEKFKKNKKITVPY